MTIRTFPTPPSDASVVLTDDHVAEANLQSHVLRDWALVERVKNTARTVQVIEGQITTLQAATGSGIVASAVFPYTNNPVAAETLIIGADVYEFVATGGDLSDDTYIGVVREAAADDTYANLAAAINATTVGNAHAELFQTDSTTPALANGTENVLAVHVPGDNKVYLFAADAPGGTKVEGSAPNIALSDTATNGGPWEPTNLNLALGAANAPITQVAHVVHTVVAGDLSATQPLKMPVPFTPVAVKVAVVSADGVAQPNRYVEAAVGTAVGAQEYVDIDLVPAVPGASRSSMTVNVPLLPNDTSEVLVVAPRGAKALEILVRRGTTALASVGGGILFNVERNGTSMLATGALDAEAFTAGYASKALSAMQVDITAGDTLRFSLVSDNADATGEGVSVDFAFYEKVIATDVLFIDVYGE